MKYFEAILAAFRSLNRRDVVALANLVLPVIFVTVVGLLFSHFVVTAIEANITINLGIMVAGLFGVFLIVERMVDAQRDMRILVRFGQEAGEGAEMTELLQQHWVRARYVRHYLARIANTEGTLSTQLEHSAIESELQALNEDYESRMELPQFLVGFMIAMGLLGTFIGLLETLTGISGMLNGLGGSEDVQQQFAKLVVELRKPLAGMGIAFSASMFGLVTSLMLAIMMTSLRRYIRRVISVARNVMHDLTNTAARQNESRMSQFNMMMQAQQPVFDPLASGHSSIAIQSSIDLFVKKIEVLVQAFTTQGEGTRKLNELMGVGPRMKETNEKSLEILKAMAFTAEEQHRTMGEVITAIEAMSEAQRQMHNKQQSSIQSLIDVNTGTSRALFSLLETQRASHTDQKSDMQALSEGNSEMVRISGLGVEAQKQLRNEMSTLLRSLGNQVTDLRDVEISGGRHLNDMKENIVKLVDSMALINIIAGNMTEQSALVTSLVDTLRMLHKELSQQNQLQARMLNQNMPTTQASGQVPNPSPNLNPNPNASRSPVPLKP